MDAKPGLDFESAFLSNELLAREPNSGFEVRAERPVSQSPFLSALAVVDPEADEFEEEAGNDSVGELEEEWVGAADGEVAPWAAGIDPFPAKPTVTFHISDDRMKKAFAPVTVGTAMPVCTALVD